MPQSPTVRIAMTGASGFVGLYLNAAFKSQGCETIILGRPELALPPEDLAHHLQNVDAVVNLAGAPVIARWSKAYKTTLYESRINTTRTLVAAFSHMATKPRVFISTSAIGYYAAGGPHTEKKHVRAENFLGDLTVAWEQGAHKAEELDIRTVIFRFGIVLGKKGGALAKMLPPFKFGLGGTIGDGRQPFSWIHLHDLKQAYLAAIDNSSYAGSYNLTAPCPTTNLELTRTLAKILNRPAFFRVPEFVLRLQFGEGAQTLTTGQEVLPERLVEQGFPFKFTEIEEALQDCLS